MNGDTYIVTCLDEGERVLATRQIFPTEAKALAYAATVALSRLPHVISGRWHQLRPPAYHLFIPNVYEKYNPRCARCQMSEEAHLK